MPPVDNKKSWTWEGSLKDHVRVLKNLPFFFVAPLVLKPEQCETVHISVNSVLGCPYCTELHCELGRMAGLQDSYGLMRTGNFGTSEEIEACGVFSEFGRIFAQHEGRGEDVKQKYDDIAAQYGPMAAMSAEGLAYFLFWGALGGNTIEGFTRGTIKMKTKEGSSAIFEALFVLYYGVLFLIIALMSSLLKLLPSRVPPALNIAIGLILPLVASMWIIPYALVALLVQGVALITPRLGFGFLNNFESSPDYLGGAGYSMLA